MPFGFWFCNCFNYLNVHRNVNVCKKMFGEAYNIFHYIQVKCIARVKADGNDELQIVDCDIGELERRRVQFISLSESLGQLLSIRTVVFINHVKAKNQPCTPLKNVEIASVDFRLKKSFYFALIM